MRSKCALALFWALLASVNGVAGEAAEELRPVADAQAKPLPGVKVWLRAWLRVPENMTGSSGGSELWRESMSLTLQDLPGAFTVLLNGQKIIESRDIPADKPRRFKVPKGILEKGVYNSLVLEIDGAATPRGLTVAPLFAGYFDEIRMDRPWLLAMRQPSESELKPSATAPAHAVYAEKDFRPATSVMQMSDAPTRGKFVAPADALKNLKPESDLVVEELLHEPQVAQPTHVSFDERGRMWVAQYRQYPFPAGVKMISRDKYYRSKYDRTPPAPPNHTPGADIISVHEDRDGDGVYEKHTNILSGLNMANAALRGYGGIWVMNTPYLMFYPDANGDDVPDGPPQVRLQGFGLEDTHSVANGLAWGPDGWLYGAQGSTTTARITRPDVDPPNATGVYIEGCMVWRYHPEKKIYEIFADGSGNTFGVSFDAEGRLFTGHNGGETRGWHHIQEGHYLKQGKDPGKFGPSSHLYDFGELPMMRSTNPIPRFTHMTIMAEGTALPERWRGKFIGADPLHHSLIAAGRKRVGSTFQTSDTGVPLRTDDRTFRPVYLANAADGSLVIADFREEFIAHGQNYQSQIDPATGRIYRLRGKDLPLERDTNLAVKSAAELVALLSHPNMWHRQTAVRVLGERRDPASLPLLLALLEKESTHPALEALWALHQMGRLDEKLALKTVKHPDAVVRAWTIRVLGDDRNLPPAFAAQLIAQAATESDAEVRCQILSSALRLPSGQGLPLLKAIAHRSDDTGDAFIPFMAWLVMESYCANQREAVLALFDQPDFWQAPLVRQSLASKLMRRFAASGTRQELSACATLLTKAPGDAERNALMLGFEEAFKGRPVPVLPDELMKALAATGRMSLILRVRQGEAAAVDEAMKLLADEKAAMPQRLAAVRVFGEVKNDAASAALLNIAVQEGPVDLRAAAFGALQLYDGPAIAESVVKVLPGLPAPVLQGAALNLLATRASWSTRLVETFAAGKIKRSAFSSDLLSRLRQHSDDSLTALLDKHFPAVAPAARESLRPRIEQVRGIIAAREGDPYKGEPLFAANCGVCHTLFFKGGKVGPDLTSYQRDDLSTMLTSIIDPNAEIREGFQNYLVTATDGRRLSGIVADQDANVVVLRGADGTEVTLRRTEIKKMVPAGSSLMPEGILDNLSDEDIRNLFGYLRQSQPIVK
ncbi:MAG TPA: PVC-type heme-binding CxxCH protein [Planctomycetota bacterium]|nr:PVC-type heme-binding CxxCH protein [Planctomycetota bacterium]